MKEYNAEYHYEPYWNYGAFAHTPCQAEIVFDIDDAGTSKENKGKCEECGETITIERDEWDRIQAEFGAETFDTEGKICSGCQIYGYWDDRQPCPMCRGEYDAEDEWSEGRHGTTTYYTTYIPTPELPDIKCKECGDSMYVDSLDYNGDDCEIIYACSCKYVAPTCNECGVSINSWACGSGEGLCPMHSTCKKPECLERKANLGIASDGKEYPKRDLSDVSIYGRGLDAETFDAEEKENERHTVNELLGKEVKIFPRASSSKFGIIEQINENGVLFKITRTPGYSEPRDWSDTDAHSWLVGTLVWLSWPRLDFRTVPTDNKDAETLTPQKDTGTWKIGRDATFPSGKLDFTPPQPKTITPKSPSATIPSWATPLATVIGFGLGFLGIRELKRRA